MQRHSVTSLETARSLANGHSSGGAEGDFPRNYSVSYLSFVYGRSLRAELNGGENSLHWKANMLPLFSIMALWSRQTAVKQGREEQARCFMLVLFLLVSAWTALLCSTLLAACIYLLHGPIKNIINKIFVYNSNTCASYIENPVHCNFIRNTI